MRDVLYSAIFDDGYPFEALAAKVEKVVHPAQLENVNAYLVIWGGEDISPYYYHQKAGRFTGASNFPSRRDAIEAALIQGAFEKEIPVIGICRGAQLMCALLGGSLAQHVVGHAGPDHYIRTKDGQVMMTSSLHHQMMLPAGAFEVLAETSSADGNPLKLSAVYFGGGDERLQVDSEVEIVAYPEGLAIQGHPEFMQLETSLVKYCTSKIEEYYP